MSEETVEVEATSTDAAEAKPSNGRGRPRPEATIERDKQVFAYLSENGAKTRKELVEGTGIAGNEVYLSLYRLKRDGAIVKNGASWAVAGPEAEAPEAPVEVSAE
jgi:predicted HTH transcriptional regulator